MIELERIEYVNFFNIRKASVPLSGQGLVAIEGDNGAGKTSMFIEGPFFALFGKSIRTKKAVGNKVCRRGAKQWAVQLTLNDGTRRYHIRRSRGFKNIQAGLSVICDGKDLARGTDDATQDFIIRDLIGLTPEASKQSVFFTAEMLGFPSLPDGQKKEVFDNLLQLDSLERALEATKGKIAEKKKSLTTTTSSLTIAREKIVQEERLLAQSREFSEKWDKEHAERLNLCLLAVEEARKEAETGVLDTSSLRSEVEKATQELEEAQKTIQRLRTELESAKTSLNEEDRKASSQISVLQDRVRAQTVNLQKLERGGAQTCPACNQPLPAQDLSEHVTEAKKALSACNGELEAAVFAWAEKKKLLSDAVETRKEPLQAAEIAYREISGRVSKGREQIAAAESLANHRKRALEVAEKRVAEVRAEVNSFLEKIDKHTHDLQEARGTADALELRVGLLEGELRDELALETLFGMKGCRVDLLQKAIPHLNKAAEEFRRILDTEIQVKFRINSSEEAYAGALSVDVTNPSGAESYEWDSRGERRRVDMLLLLSLLDIANTRGRKSIGQAFFDEAFESLDTSGQSGTVSLLRHVAKERSSIFVLTHSAAELAGKVDKIWRVKDGELFT